MTEPKQPAPKPAGARFDSGLQSPKLLRSFYITAFTYTALTRHCRDLAALLNFNTAVICVLYQTRCVMASLSNRSSAAFELHSETASLADDGKPAARLFLPVRPSH